MPSTHSMFLFEREFDDFLSASIGEEKNGMTLSVMSAFARRNVDPWQEASRLSRLPREVATGELSAMIAELPFGAPGLATPRTIAERLIGPLPRHAGSAVSPGKALSGGVVKTRRETVKTAVVLLFLLVTIVFAAIGAQRAPVAPTPTATDAVGKVN